MATASRHPAIAIALTAANIDNENGKVAAALIFLYLVVSGIAVTPYLKWLLSDKGEIKEEAG